MLKITVDDAGQLRDMRWLSDKEARQVAVWALTDPRDDVLTCLGVRMILGSEKPAIGTKQQESRQSPPLWPEPDQMRARLAHVSPNSLEN